MSEQQNPQPEGAKRKKPNAWMITTFAILAIFAASMLISDHGMTGAAISLSSQQVAQDTMDFINTELLGGQAEAKFVNITEKSGLYLLTFEVEGTMYTTYVSKDGKFMFPHVIDVEAYKEFSQETSKSEKSETVTKTDKPVVKIFVMSFCPYGQQAMSGLKPVAELFGEKVEMQPHYVIYENYCGYGKACTDYPQERANFCLDSDKERPSYCSMHGIAELNEDIRQLCVFNLYPEKFWDYTDYIINKCSLSNIETCWKEAADSVGIDTAEIESCQAQNAEAYAQAELNLNSDYGVRGSPTIFINDVAYNGARSPEAFKNAICDAFTESPEECSETLSSQASASGSC